MTRSALSRDGAPRSVVLKIRLSPKEKARLEKLALAEGRTASDYIRDRVLPGRIAKYGRKEAMSNGVLNEADIFQAYSRGWKLGARMAGFDPATIGTDFPTTHPLRVDFERGVRAGQLARSEALRVEAARLDYQPAILRRLPGGAS